jgi:ADP-ribose pyrophosphatase YjhB (NUDIX family)
MTYTTRSDLPAVLPLAKTQYCWHCKSTNVTKRGKKRVSYYCNNCKRTSGRVLIFDPNMKMYFDDQNRLIHESCGVFVRRNDGKLFLFKRAKYPYLLTIPAGHVETKDVSMKQRASVELEEETGIIPNDLSLVFNGDIVGDACLGGADIHHWHAFVAHVDDEVTPRLDDEGVSWAWYDIEQITATNTVKPVRYLLQQHEVLAALWSAPD